MEPEKHNLHHTQETPPPSTAASVADTPSTGQSHSNRTKKEPQPDTGTHHHHKSTATGDSTALTTTAALKNLLVMYAAILLTAVLTGIISHYILAALHWVGTYRDGHNWLLYLLPLLGVATAFSYQQFGKGSDKGNNLIIESIQTEAHVPVRMGIMTFIFTILSHLFGASVGREGSAVQIGGVVANKLGRLFPLNKDARKIVVHAGISAGFASIFGTPLAGAFFGMEMAYIGRLERKALIPCFTAAYLSNFVALSLGTVHEGHAIGQLPEVTGQLLLAVIVAAIAFGLFGRAFAALTHFFKAFYKKTITQPLLRAFVSAGIVVVLMLVVSGQRFEGLSLWMMDDAFKGTSSLLDPVAKLLFTSLSLGAGFQGGEVTPLFDIGSTLGSGIAQLFHQSPALFAAMGLIAVFGCAANAPLTTIMLGIDLFGATALPYYVAAAFISYYVSGHEGIYTSQLIVHPKTVRLQHHAGLRLSEIAKTSAATKQEEH